MPEHYPDLQYERSHTPGGDEPSFEEQLREVLKSAPWLAVSAVVHVIIFLILAQFPWDVGKKKEEVVTLTAAMDEQEIDPIEEEEEEEEQHVGHFTIFL